VVPRESANAPGGAESELCDLESVASHPNEATAVSVRPRSAEACVTARAA